MGCMNARAHFSEVQLSELSFAVGVINLCNRLNIGFQNVPGSADEVLGSNEVRIEVKDPGPWQIRVLRSSTALGLGRSTAEDLRGRILEAGKR